MSEKQFTSQSNGKDDLTALIGEIYSKKSTEITALMDAVFPTANNHNDTNTTPEDRADKKTTISPEKNTEENNKKPLTKMAAGALAVAMAIGGIAGLGELTTGKTASAKITIYDPKKAQEQICSTQATLEESLGLPKSTSYDTFRGCEGTTNMVTETEGGLKPGDEVKITVTTNAFGEAAAAEKVKDQDS